MMPARVWAMFRRNRLSYAAFCLFGVIVFCSLFAEVIANDRPIVAYYKDRIVLPIIFKYPDSEFNGFLGEADFRDKLFPELPRHLQALAACGFYAGGRKSE